MPNIPIIDDNPAVGTALELLLSLRGMGAESAVSPQLGRERPSAGRYGSAPPP